MGAVVLVLGKSGSGKSTSLRNFERGEIGIYNVLGKPLPFRHGRDLLQVNQAGYNAIISGLRQNNLRAYAVDDSTYLMQNENFLRARETGYGKFTEMAQHFQELLLAAAATSDDTIVYLLHHVDENADGSEKVKTVGKMLDEKYCIEGACPVVIDCRVVDGRHVFVTENDGTNLAKAPIDALPATLDNDLKAVDTALREYWGFQPLQATGAGPQKGTGE